MAFRTVETCFSELRGEAARTRADQLLSAELVEAFRYKTIMAAGWYPIGEYKALFRAFLGATGEGPELAREIGRLAARHDMAGVHKQIVARVVSPQMLFGMSQRVFSTYYDTGTFTMLESRRGFAHARAAGCLGWDACLWQEIIGSSESLLEIAGAKHVRMRVLGGGKDEDDFLELEARWA
ncbi:MAG TPA: hypothetical protein VGK73_06565 [Polyangiaceae bacterium]